MDFTFSEEQDAVRGLAAQVFEGHATAERVKEVERSEERVDRELWRALADAGLLAIAVPEEHGGSGLGLAEVCLLLEQQGRRVAPVPLWPTLVLGGLAIAELGSPEQQRAWLPGVATGDVLMTAALSEAGANDPLRPQVSATRDGDASDGRRATAWMLDRALVGLCATQVGVAEGALRMAADYTSERQQFGRPLSTFQGVALKAADAYIDTEAMRVTLWQAAWRLTAGLDATREVMVAKWWAAEGGQRVVHITQHLHGGMGADVDYPVHRYFLWGKQIEDTLGGASAQLARLGRALAEAPA